MKKNIRIIGVDPGNKGALALIDENGKVILYDMPTYTTEGAGKTKIGNIKKHTVLDEPELRDILNDDHVGSDITDSNGKFSISMKQKACGWNRASRKPDIYFKIYEGDRLLHNTMDSVMWNLDRDRKDIEIFNEPSGMPKVKLSGKLESLINSEMDLKISMSHSENYVTCFAILYSVK